MLKIALITELKEHNFIPHIKPLLAGHNVSLIERCPEYITEIAGKFDAGIVARTDFLKKLTFGARGSSLENFAGSYIESQGKPFVILDPIEQLVTSRTGKFLAERTISKLTMPDSWFKQSDFSWEIAREDTCGSLYQQFAGCDIIAEDIETRPSEEFGDIITCVGYCGIWFEHGSFRTHSIVIPLTSSFFLGWIRKFNELPQPKIFQNGQFDNFHLLRLGAPVTNYVYDTQSLFHSWYSELPKRLDAIAAFLIRKIQYWKQEGKTGNIEDYYRYNAKDTWSTANSWLSCISECPDWALRNYLEKFDLNVPCLAASIEGFRVSEDARKLLEAAQRPKLDASLKKLQARIGKPDFNPSSPVQVVSLCKALGYGKEVLQRQYDGTVKESADKKTLQKIAKKHPLAQLLIEDILSYRKARKLLSDYIDAKLYNQRFLYSLNPDGTDTGRLASGGAWFFDYGHQIQNIPGYVKDMLYADDGFNIFEIDNKTSESYCVGYCSGDENLLATLNSGKDFHCVNAERFFGIPYDQLYDDGAEKVLNKVIRDLSKRTNHGASYNMQANILIETMGAENVYRARELLKLPADWNLRQIAQFLLDSFDKSYPTVRSEWYDFISACIKLTRTLESALGWTRYCFGEPWRNKSDLNAYVAHVPQNLSVGIINRGLKRVFYELQMRHWRDFRIKAQIHDSIVGQYRIGHLHLVEAADRMVRQTVEVVDIKGVRRKMAIPTDVKAEDPCWAKIKKVRFAHA